MRLQTLTAVAAWAVVSACQTLPGTRTLWSRDTDYKELSEKLSPSAKGYYPGSEEFEKANTRWSNLDVPTVNIVIVPGTENDVVETVSFYNLFTYLYFSSIPSLYSRSHSQRIRARKQRSTIISV